MTTADPPTVNPLRSFRLLFFRLMWFFIGPMTALVAALLIVRSGSGWLTWLDLLFAIAIGVTLAARWGSLLSGDVTDEYGMPTVSRETVMRYSIRLIPPAIALWVVANAVGNHLLA